MLFTAFLAASALAPTVLADAITHLLHPMYYVLWLPAPQRWNNGHYLVQQDHDDQLLLRHVHDASCHYAHTRCGDVYGYGHYDECGASDKHEYAEPGGGAYAC